MNAEYIQGGQQLYKIDGIFNPNDKVLPINSSASLINAIMSFKQDDSKPSSAEDDSRTQKTSANSTNGPQKQSLSSVSFNDLFTFNSSSGRSRPGSGPSSSYTQIMMERW